MYFIIGVEIFVFDVRCLPQDRDRGMRIYVLNL